MHPPTPSRPKAYAKTALGKLIVWDEFLAGNSPYGFSFSKGWVDIYLGTLFNDDMWLLTHTPTGTKVLTLHRNINDKFLILRRDSDPRLYQVEHPLFWISLMLALSRDLVQAEDLKHVFV